jgi:hypothetical protein
MDQASSGSQPAAPAIDPQRMADMTAAFFNRAGADHELASRLGLASTSVHFHYADGIGATVHLEQKHVAAEARIVGTAEVELWATPAMFMAFTLNKKLMSVAIMEGDLEYRGPVRKFLRVVPIMRGCDFDMWDDARPAVQAV